MDGLGLGPHGPPIPPPATFAVVPYPVRRRPPLGLDPPSHYVFVASGPDDPNAPQEDKTKEAEPEVEKTPEKPPVSALLLLLLFLLLSLLLLLLSLLLLLLLLLSLLLLLL